MYDGLHADTTEQIVGCAIEVHRHLGPGLLESVYEAALCHEMLFRGLPFHRQLIVQLHYKGQPISHHRVDLVIAEAVVVEIKSVAGFEPIHTAQMLTYLKVTGLRVGLLLNFNVPVMKHGIRRVVL